MRAQTLVCVACTEQMRLRLPAQGWPGVRSRLQNRTQHRRQMHFNLQKSAGALASAVGMAAVAAPLRVLVCALQCQLCELVCARNVNCASVISILVQPTRVHHACGAANALSKCFPAPQDAPVAAVLLAQRESRLTMPHSGRSQAQVADSSARMSSAFATFSMSTNAAPHAGHVQRHNRSWRPATTRGADAPAASPRQAAQGGRPPRPPCRQGFKCRVSSAPVSSVSVSDSVTRETGDSDAGPPAAHPETRDTAPCRCWRQETRRPD